MDDLETKLILLPRKGTEDVGEAIDKTQIREKTKNVDQIARSISQGRLRNTKKCFNHISEHGDS